MDTRRVHWELEDARLFDAYESMRASWTVPIALDVTVSIKGNKEREALTHCPYGIRKAGTRFQFVRSSNAVLSQSVALVHIDKHSVPRLSNNLYLVLDYPNGHPPNAQLVVHLVQNSFYSNE
jgi:hypothetical protein